MEVHGIYDICNTGGIEVHIEEGYEPFVYWRYSIIDTEPQKWHRAKIYNNFIKGFYFKANGKRIYLDEIMRV